MDPSLLAIVDTTFFVEAGSTTAALYRDEFAPAQIIRVSDAQLNWTPFEFLSVADGAINQMRVNNPLLIATDTALHGPTRDLQFPVGRFYFGVSAEQTIATVATFSNQVGQGASAETGGSPTFYLEQAKLGLGPSKSDFLELRASTFNFSGLVGGVANESRLLGNSVTRYGEAGAPFLYGFKGYEFGAGSAFHLSRRLKVHFNSGIILFSLIHLDGWGISNISRFMLFIGPISSIFDCATFALMWYVFKANTPERRNLFQ